MAAQMTRSEEEIVSLDIESPSESRMSIRSDREHYLAESKRHKGYVTLTQARAFRWGNMQSNFLKLPTQIIWELVIMISCIINAVLCSSRILFTPPDTPSSVNVFTYYLILDALYLPDIVLRLLHKYWKKLQENMPTVNTPLWSLVIDIITLLLQPWIFSFHSIRLGRYIRLASIFRLHRIRLMFKIQGNVQTHRWMWLAGSFLTSNIIIIHSCVCIWHLLKIYENDYVPNRTSTQYFLLAAYYTVQQLGGIGIGEDSDTSFLESLKFLSFMLIGYFLTTIMYIVLFSIALANRRLVRFTYYAKLEGVQSYYKYTKITPGLIRELKQYSDVLWERKSGLNEAPYFYQLPTCLQMSLTYDVNCSHLRRSLLFTELSEPILRRLSLVMKHEFLIPGQIIFHQNVVKHGMISIATGIVEVLSDEDGQSPIVAFKSGTILGEAALFLSVPSKATVRAATYTEIQVLNRIDFINLMLHFPDAMRQLRDRLSLRLDMARANKAASQRTELTVFNLLVPLSHLFRPIEALKRHLKGEVVDAGKFITDFMPLYKLAENVTMIHQPPICLNYKLPWILEADSSFMRAWEIIIVISILAVCLPWPYYAVFYTSGIPSALQSFDGIATVMYAANIYVQLTTAVVLKDRTLRKFPQIVSYRMRSLGIYIDVFSVLPLDEFKYVITTERKAKYFYAFQLLKLLRMWRLFTFINKKETEAKSHIIPMKIFKWTVYLLLLLYYCGALLYILACPFHKCQENSWYVTNMREAVAEQQISPCYKNKWVMSMYFAATTIMLLGFGDLIPVTDVERLILIVYMIVGIFFAGFCMIDFIATFLVNEEHRYKYRRNMQILRRFLQHRKIAEPLIKRVQNFMILQWEFDRGIGQQVLITETPHHLKTAMQVCLLQDSISNIPLFKNVDVDFLMMIVRGAKLKLLPPNEVICYCGDENRDLIIIQRGECTSEVFGKIQRLGPGSAIGVLEMLCGIPKQATVTTDTHCFIITITFSDFARSIRMFPLHRQEIEGVLDEEDIGNKMMEVVISRRMVSVAKMETKKKGTMFKFLEESFHNTCASCRKSKGVDPYWKPFSELGKLGLIGICLMPICIRPNGTFLKIWNLARCVLITLMSLTLPLIVAIPPYMKNLDGILNASYMAGFVDVYINLHVGYYGDEGQLIKHPRYTCFNYLKKSCLIDILSLVPLKLLILWVARDHDEGHDPVTHMITPHTRHCMWHVNLLLQLHRVFGGFSYLESDIRKLGKLFRIIMMFPILLLTLNMFTCILFAKICSYRFFPDPNDTMRDSLMMYHFQNRTTAFGYLICNEMESLEIDNFQQIKHPFDFYILLFYWVTSCLTQTGPGDITARSTMAMMFTICLSLGLIIFSCLSGYWASLRCSHSKDHSTYQENYKHLLNFLIRENLEPNLYNTVKRYFEYVWQRTGGVDPQVHLISINTALAEDVMLGLYERALREVPLFNKVEKSFIRVVATRLSALYFLRDDFIVKKSYIQYRIYIVLRGSVEITNEDGNVVANMGIGGLFGNIRTGIPCLSSVSARASKNLDVLVLSSQEFYAILGEYPRVRKYMDNLLKSVTHYIMPVTILDNEEEIKLMEEGSIGQISIVSEEETKYSSSAWNFLLPWRWFQFALRPDHKLFMIVRFIVMVLSYSYISITCYYFVTHQLSRPVSIAIVLLEFVYWFRIFLKLHEAYLNVYGIYVTSFPLIVEHYFKNKWNVFRDVLPNIPLFTIGRLFPVEKRQIIYTYLVIFQWLRVIYIIEFFKRAELPLLANRKILRVAKILMLHIFLLHFSSCVWLATACRFMKCYTGTWLHTYDPQMTEGSMFYNYAISAYYIINLCTSTGTGDIYPVNKAEIITSTFFMIFGKCLTAFIIGDIISILHLSRSQLMDYEYKIKELATFLKNQNLSETQFSNIWKYAQVLWAEETGLQMPLFLENAPKVLRCDIMYNLYGYHLKNCILFEGINEALIRQCCSKLKRVIFIAGNYIVQQGDADGCMYWVHKGTVSILTVHPNLTETVHDVLKAPSVFGLVTGLKYGWAHRFSYRAETTSHMLIMSIQDWEEILRLFPEDREKIFDRLTNLHEIL